MGIEKLNQYVNPTNTIKYFIDIGSGRGKLPCWYAGIPLIIKSIGIEIVLQRHLDGLDLVDKLSKKFPNITEKIELRSGSIEQYNLRELVATSSDTLVWICNLCFGEKLTNKVFIQILNQLSKGTIICCSKKPTLNIDSDTINKLELDEQIQHIQMSWWNNLSDVFVCKIV